jgi:hypothetical protein
MITNFRKINSTMRKLILVSAIIAFCLKGFSQFGSFGIYATYNSHSLTEVKEFFNEFKYDLPVSGKTMDNFPPVVGVKLVYTNQFRSINFNLNVGYNSTGGRISYADYSGKINIDMVANVFPAGIQINIPMYSKNKFSLFLSPGLSAAFIRFKVKSEFQLYDQTEKDKIILQSRALGGGIGFTIEKRIKFLAIRAEIAADYFVPAKITSPENEGAFVTDNGGKKVLCQIGGLRSGIGILYNFDYRK